MLTLSQRLQSASNLLSSAYVDSYSDRMMVGRRAQLGESMVWRSTLSAEPDNGHLTYGEVSGRVRRWDTYTQRG